MADAGLAVSEVPGDETKPSTRYLGALVVVELYAVAAYVAAAVVPYLWRHSPAPPTWVWLVPAWLLGVPGFWITLLGPVLAFPLAFIGAGLPAAQFRTLSARLRRWCIAAGVLTGAYAVYSCTPLAHTIAAWVAD